MLGATLLAILGCCLNDLSGLVIVKDLGDIRAETPVAGHDRTMAVRIQTELAVLTVRAYQQLLGGLDGELVRGQSVVDISSIALRILNVGTVAAHPDNDVRVVEREGADRARVDVTKLSDKLMQPLVALSGRRDVAVVSLGLAIVEG